MQGQPHLTIEKFPDGIEKMKRSSESEFVFISKNQIHLRIRILNESIVRISYSEFGVFGDDFSYAIDPDFSPSTVEQHYSETETSYIITLRNFKILIEKANMKVHFHTLEDRVILEEEKGFHWEENFEYGGSIVQMTKKVQEGEAYYGLGDKPTHQNLYGKRLVNWGTDEYGFHVHTDPIYKSIPFYYGVHHSLGYGIFFDNSFKSYFDFASERRSVTSFWAMGGEMNYYFIYGPKLLDVSKSYMELTGKPPLPPMWSFGYQQSKWSYQPESQVREIATKLREHQIPCDVIHIDIDYMDGFRCFTWDPEKFPAPKKMISDLHDVGIKTIVIIDPGIKIDFDYRVFVEAFEKGYFCRRADGPYIKGKVWPGECYFPDYTNPEVRDWWAGLYQEFMEELEVDGVWNDMNEPALFEVENKSFPEDVRHDYDGHPCSHRKGHNVYGMQMARATNEGQKRFSPDKRVLTITRSCYSGIQRFSGAWTGDNIANWDHVWVAAVQCVRCSISGLSYIGADVGGFIGQPDGELYLRFLQVGLFHPFFRTHSSGDHGDQEPWSFGEEYTPLIRENIEWRYKLLPYLYTAFYQTSAEGNPYMRPLSFEDQTNLKALHNDEIFLVGDHLLTAPVVSPGATGRNTYLPSGKWYDFHTHQAHEGDSTKWIATPLDRPLLLARASSVIPLFPVQQYVGEKSFDRVTLRVFLGEESISSIWYEDDGTSYDYQKGIYLLHEFHLESRRNGWKLHQSLSGKYDSPILEYDLQIIGPEGTTVALKVDGVDTQKQDGLWIVNSNFEDISITSLS